MMGEGKCQVINPPNNLQAKVPETGGPSMGEMVRVADEALQEIKDNYETFVRADLQKINDAISRASAAPSAAADALEEICTIGHDIKGQAASLDYPLLTAIAQSLCRFISTSEPAALKGLDVITVHSQAMETVVTHRIRGKIRADGEKVLDALDAAVQKALTRSGQS